MVSRGNYLGEFEELVLISVASLADDAYGVSITKYIADKADRNVHISAVHEALKRLERKGYLKSRMGGATQERGGRRKRYFLMTASGKRSLEEFMKLKIQLYKRVPDFSLKLG